MIKINVWIIFALCLLCSFSCECSMKEMNTNRYTPLIDFSEIEPIILTDRPTILTTYGTGSTFYLDADNGDDDTGLGTLLSPWQTLAKSQASCPEGSIIILRDGNYGSFNDTIYSSSRTNWTVYINQDGHTPRITSVKCVNGRNYDLRLIFFGIKIAPQTISEGFDPGPSAPYNKTDNPIYVYDANYIRFYNCEIVGTNKYLTLEAVYLREADNIVIERCNIHTTGEGIVYIFSSNITLSYNYIHEVCACFFKDGYAGNSFIRIEGNHAHDAGYSTSDIYGEDAAYHGSMIALNNAKSIVRNNILHDGGGTNAINFYADGNPVYGDVLIENNLIYNPTATTCVNVDRITENVVIRNNIFIGKKRNEDFGEYMYNNAIYVGGYASGYNGSGLSIYNNIFVGRAVISPDSTYVNKDNNIAYYGNDFATLQSIIALSIPDSAYFESVFFNGALNLEYGATSDQILNLTFAPSSDGINFGDLNNQPSDCLGTLDTNDEFIIPSSLIRNNNYHSAGCYEIN